MTWETPNYEEIRMDAEIGSYQRDEESDASARSNESESSAPTLTRLGH